MAYSYQGIDHVQVAAPKNQEGEARAFYGKKLGFQEIKKPEELAKRGGVWFQVGHHQLHVGVENDFHPAKKAHPADRKSTRLNYSHVSISYAVCCLKRTTT